MRWGNVILFLAVSFFSLNLYAQTGILVLAHGSMQSGMGGHGGHGGHAMVCDNSSPTQWEKTVLEAVGEIGPSHPVPIEVAFGMWNTMCFQAGVERLLKKSEDMDHLVVLPLFISSYSVVIEMQKFIFKVRSDKLIPIPTVKQIKFDGTIEYLSAIDYDEVIADILLTRARTLISLAGERGKSMEPKMLELNLVMHGPNGEQDNHYWLAMGHRYAADLASLKFAEIHVLSLRDDADEPVWDRAKQLLREAVEGAASRNHAALVLPLLLAPGGIEDDLLERLEGLDYVWSGEAILPDSHLGTYLNKKIRSIYPSKEKRIF